MNILGHASKLLFNWSKQIGLGGRCRLLHCSSLFTIHQKWHSLSLVHTKWPWVTNKSFCLPYINQLIYEECARQWSLGQMASHPLLGKRWKVSLQFNIVSVRPLKWRKYQFVLSKVFRMVVYPLFQNIFSQECSKKGGGKNFFLYSMRSVVINLAPWTITNVITTLTSSTCDWIILVFIGEECCWMAGFLPQKLHVSYIDQLSFSILVSWYLKILNHVIMLPI